MSRNGGFRWAHKRVPLSHLLEGQYIGLEEVDDGIWDVYYSTVRLGQMDERLLRVEDALVDCAISSMSNSGALSARALLC